jgi:hypothetical protein
MSRATKKTSEKREKEKKSKLEGAEHGLNLHNPCSLNEV